MKKPYDLRHFRWTDPARVRTRDDGNFVLRSARKIIKEARRNGTEVPPPYSPVDDGTIGWAVAYTAWAFQHSGRRPGVPQAPPPTA